MAKGTFQFRRADAIVSVLDPIETTGLTFADLPALKERARRAIVDGRAALQRELGIAADDATRSDDA